LDWKGELGGKRADAFAGVWLRTGDLDSNFYVNLKGARGAPTSISLQNADAADVFGEARLFVTDHIAVVGGATYGTARRDYQSFAVPGPAGAGTFNLKTSKNYDWVAPRIGLLWEDQGGDQVFANLTRSVEPPNFGSLTPTNVGFIPIKAQTAWTGEIGARGRRGPFTYDVTLYRAQLRDELLMFAVDQDHPASTFNADKTIHQGLEAALDWKLTDALRLRQTYTWSDFKFDGDTKYRNNRLPIVPEHFYRAELRYDHPAGWFVAPSVEWSASDAWVDFANTTKTPSYAILNLNAGWTVKPGVSLFVDARNLFDKAYVSNVQAQILASAASAAYWPGDGRSVFGGVTLEF